MDIKNLTQDELDNLLDNFRILIDGYAYLARGAIDILHVNQMTNYYNKLTNQNHKPNFAYTKKEREND